VDSSIHIGGGHVSRCLALAKFIRKKGCEVEFFCAEFDGNIITKIRNKNFIVHTSSAFENSLQSGNNDQLDHVQYAWEIDANLTVEVLTKRNKSYDLLIVDSYHLDNRWEKEVSRFVSTVMVIDDLGNRNHYCDILLDQVHSSSDKKYNGLLDKPCLTLFGTKFTLLEESFMIQRNKVFVPGALNCNRTVHVFFGTNDISGYTFRFSKLILENFPDFSVKAVVSGRFSSSHELVSLKNLYKNRFDWVSDVDDIAQTMQDCNIALGSPGMITWERMCMGLPTLCITNSKNQIKILKKIFGSVIYKKKKIIKVNNKKKKKRKKEREKKKE
jgi:UDP-2,4-diacetamido-2,4,6-trideoxy-beta-L-altropyranose hydrolase